MIHRVFQVFLLLIITTISTSDVTRINCSMGENNRKCTVYDLTVAFKNYTFVPVAPDSNAVVKFEIVKSIIPVLTSQICTILTKLKYFAAIAQHIEIVEDYAFNNCTDVTEINLEKNNIHKLGVGVFSNTKKLQKLHLLGGSMEQIDVDLFSNLGELQRLLYGANGLKELPVAAIKNLKKLELLYIYSNDLDDLDAQGFVDNLPSLSKIYLNDNHFHCDRLIEILDIFKARSITVDDHLYTSSMKRRDYVPRKINKIICLTQAQQEAEKLKKALAGSLDDLKTLPIGKAVIQLKDVVTSGFQDSDSAIADLSNNLNATSDDLSEQISNLNETVHTSLLAINESVNGLIRDVIAIKQKLDQNIKDSAAVQQQLEQKLKDSATLQQQLEQKLKDNAGLQQRLQQNLKDTADVQRKHNETIASLMDEQKKLANFSSLEQIENGNNGRTYKSLNTNMAEVWVCLIMLLVIEVAIVVIGVVFFKKSRNVSVDVPLLQHDEL